MQNFCDVVENAAYIYWALSSFVTLNKDERYIYFQQDGARAHTSEQTIEFLREFFNDRLVSITLWPQEARTRPQWIVFLWGQLQNKIFASPPATIKELKRCITMESQNIT